MALSVRQLLFDVINNSQTVVCDTFLIDGNYPQHNISLVSLVFSSDLCKENDYCKTVSLYACRLLLLL